MTKLKLPRIIGHRGCAAYAPENTLEAIHTAADMGVKWVELDVKLTKDQVPVIFHDDTLERTTNGHGPVAEITYEDLKQLDAGSWFTESFGGCGVPTLEQAVDVLLEYDMGLNLEIKPCPGREVETAEAALDILSQIWDDHRKLLISSFSFESMEVAQDMAQDWARGFLLPSEWPQQWQEMAGSLDVSTFNIDGNSVTRHELEELIALGKPILAYTINDPEQCRQLQRWGVYGFFTDAPDVIEDSILQVH